MLIIDTRFMQRCIELAKKAKGHTSPNPLVGAVLEYNGKIVGEGYHTQAGKPHAEVMAINSLKNKELLPLCTLYVSLEPCAHYGKTPPCAKLIIDSGIKKVVIGTTDLFEEVAGRGIEMLQKAGVEVNVGLLQKECIELNKHFFTFHKKKRPYIYLKWAQSKDYFIDKIRDRPNYPAEKFSSEFTSVLNHKLRTEVDAILVGTNTAYLDNPTLTSRLWSGKNPTRIFIDRSLKIPLHYNLYSSESNTIIVTDISNQNVKRTQKNIDYIFLDFKLSHQQRLPILLEQLYERQIQSLIVEGGTSVISSFMMTEFWDEIRVETSEFILGKGVVAPQTQGYLSKVDIWNSNLIEWYVK